MAQCKDIDAALKRLEDKINEQNREIAALKAEQKRCCSENKSNNSKNNTDLEKRVKELEKVTEALKTGIVGCLNNFADIENTNREAILAFQGLFQIVNPLLDTVSSIAQFIGE